METGILLKKNGHSTFHTSTPGSFNSFREVIQIMILFTLKLIEEEVSAKKMLWLLFTPFR